MLAAPNAQTSRLEIAPSLQARIRRSRMSILSPSSRFSNPWHTLLTHTLTILWAPWIVVACTGILISIQHLGVACNLSPQSAMKAHNPLLCSSLVQTEAYKMCDASEWLVKLVRTSAQGQHRTSPLHTHLWRSITISSFEQYSTLSSRYDTLQSNVPQHSARKWLCPSGMGRGTDDIWMSSSS